jgi:hypothetical protein
MPGTANDLHGVLDGYRKFLREKDLVPVAHQPHLVRWVREFLLFARAHAGYSFEQTLDLFLAEVGGRVGTKPWPLQQASDAIRIYRYQYRGAKAGAVPKRSRGGLGERARVMRIDLPTAA